MAASGGSARSSLSREHLVSDALRIAEESGLDSVTIRRLAQSNGVTSMALYWHFSDKEALFQAMCERVLSEVDVTVDLESPWDARLQGMLGALLTALRRHSAAAALILPRILNNEPGLRLAEDVLAVLAEAGFASDEAAGLLSHLASSVVTLVTAEPGPDRFLEQHEREAMIRSKRATFMALDPSRFPHVIATADALSACASEDDYFARGLDLLVQGTVSLSPQPV